MRLTDTFVRFARSEQFGGILLIACTLISLLLANSAAGPVTSRSGICRWGR
jgi:NhaA family Na+:H+ antiporter